LRKETPFKLSRKTKLFRQWFSHKAFFNAMRKNKRKIPEREDFPEWPVKRYFRGLTQAHHIRTTVSQFGLITYDKM